MSELFVLTEHPSLYLASRSPRRQELLRQLGIEFEELMLREAPGRTSDVNETQRATAIAPRSKRARDMGRLLVKETALQEGAERPNRKPSAVHTPASQALLRFATSGACHVESAAATSVVGAARAPSPPGLTSI